MRLTTTVVLAVIFGSVCWQRGMQRSTEQGVRRIAGLQFLAVINMGYNNAFVVLPILAVERGVFYRERAAHYYSSIPYALAQADVEVPFVFVQVSFACLAVCTCSWAQGRKGRGGGSTGSRIHRSGTSESFAPDFI